jgi:hypothetical protein
MKKFFFGEQLYEEIFVWWTALRRNFCLEDSFMKKFLFGGQRYEEIFVWMTAL